VTRAYAQLESDTGRPKDGLVRLLAAARINDRDPELWAGLATRAANAVCCRRQSPRTTGPACSIRRSRPACGIPTYLSHALKNDPWLAPIRSLPAHDT
jgi:hypothetical protein